MTQVGDITNHETLVLVKLARDLTNRPFGPEKVAFWTGNPLISEKFRLVKYYNLARLLGAESKDMLSQ